MSLRWAGVAASVSLLGWLASCGGAAFTDGSGGTKPTGASGATTSSDATTGGLGGATSSSETGDGVASSSSAGGAGGAGGESSGTTGAGGTTSTSSSTSASSSTTSGGGCGLCMLGLTCCGDTCRNLTNDPKNCGACGNQCGGDISFCDGTHCVPPPCDAATDCSNGGTCCGAECCTDGKICCAVPGNVATLGCVDPVEGTCPVGCPACE